jgi:hypothetical protein
MLYMECIIANSFASFAKTQRSKSAERGCASIQLVF